MITQIFIETVVVVVVVDVVVGYIWHSDTGSDIVVSLLYVLQGMHLHQYSSQTPLLDGHGSPDFHQITSFVHPLGPMCVWDATVVHIAH